MSRLALVVDDSMLIRHTVCRFLEERGFAVESATNGVEALEILASVQPSIVITDLLMPGMSGSELITALKSRPETAAIPIVIIAGKASSSQAHPPDARANFVIYKDIDMEEQLQKAIAALCGPAAGQ
jgi:CheY-like chemotaxis protein